MTAMPRLLFSPTCWTVKHLALLASRKVYKMRRMLRLTALVLLSLHLAVGQDPNKPLSADLSIITGRVIFDDTLKPAPRYRVQLIPNEALSDSRGPVRIPTAITNENGEFSLQRVRAGEYYVVAKSIDEHGKDAQSFPIMGPDPDINAANLARFKKENIKIIVDGRRNLDINLRVPNRHFGSIAGRVVDTAGQPAAGASVHLLSRRSEPFRQSMVTDQEGYYKFWGLKTGEYIVAASPPPKTNDDKEARRSFEGLLGATYYPSTLTSQNSAPVTVLPEREIVDINVTLIERALHSVTGVVRIQGDQRVVSNAGVRLKPKEQEESVTSEYYSSTDKNGRWSIPNVPSGLYQLSVEPRTHEPDHIKFVQVQQDLTVDREDLEDLLIEVSAGSRISGVVTVEGSGIPFDITISVNRLIGNGASSLTPANSVITLREAGTFELTGVPSGEITFSAFPSPQDRFYVKSIEANGRDLLRTNLTIADGSETGDVRVVVSSNVGVITGRILSTSDNKPLAGVNVILKRVSNDNLRLFGGNLAIVTDKSGQFSLSAAPGVYLVLAWRLDGGPAAFSTAQERAERDQNGGITLSGGERKQIDLRVP